MDRSSSSGSLEYAIKKYGEDALLASSSDLGWSGVAAELRIYERGVTEVTSAHPEVEIAVPIGPSYSLVTRSSGRIVDRGGLALRIFVSDRARSMNIYYGPLSRTNCSPVADRSRAKVRRGSQPSLKPATACGASIIFFWNGLDLHRKLDRFAAYYNQRRVHPGLSGRTPFEQCDTTACTRRLLRNQVSAMVPCRTDASFLVDGATD